MSRCYSAGTAGGFVFRETPLDRVTHFFQRAEVAYRGRGAAMLHGFIVKLCRCYQSFFPRSHPQEERLVRLYQAEALELFHKEYFEHEFEKGAKFLKRFEPHSNEWCRWNVLDFGCGSGGLTYQLGTRFREAWGIDTDSEQVAFAARQINCRSEDNVKFCHYEGKQLPFPDASFDCIFCVDVIEHLPTPGFFVSEFLRVLRPGGQLLLSFGPPWRHPHGKHMWTQLPGWWTHLIFPRTVVMEVRGLPPETTWEELGLHRLTVSAFESIMARSPFEKVYMEYQMKTILRPFQRISWLREFVIAEVTTVFRKPVEGVI